MISDECLIGKTGDWNIRLAAKIIKKVEKVLKTHKITKSNFERILHLMIDLSHIKGGLFVIGDSKKVLTKSASMKKFQSTDLIIKNTSINNTNVQELLNYASEDGALILDEKMKILGIARRLLPKKTMIGVSGSKGTKHRAAADISNETKSIAIAISEDNLITIYEKGQVLIDF